MKIECPKCKAFYNVDDSKIPERGIYGRCPKCQARFLVKKNVGLQESSVELEKEKDKVEGNSRQFDKEVSPKIVSSNPDKKSMVKSDKVGSLGLKLFLVGVFFIIAILVFNSLYDSFIQERLVPSRRTIIRIWL